MELFVYIVIRLDSGPICLTDGDPGVFNFMGKDLAFVDEIVSYSLPSRSLDIFQSELRGQSISVSFFSEDLAPGYRMMSSNRVQRSPVQALVYDGSQSHVIFDGEVNSFSFDISTNVASVSASTGQVDSLLAFPPGSVLQEDRFVDRQSFSPDKYPGLPSFASGIQYLVQNMEFNTEFGTPSNPASGYSFQKDVIQIDTNITQTIIDGFLHFDNKASDLAVPVVYGRNSNVALNILGHYRVVHQHATAQYFKVFIAIVAGHRVAGDSDAPVEPACDFGLRLMLDAYDVTETPDNHNQTHRPNCHYGVDSLGQEFSYFTFAVEHFDSTGSGDNYEQAVQPTSFDIYSCHVPVLNGKVGIGGSVISGLGSVLEDLWINYTELGLNSVNRNIIKRSKSILDGYSIDIVFNEFSPGQTLISVISDRIQSQFPVAFSFVNGKLGWTPTQLTEDLRPIAKIKYGINAYSRGEFSETDASSVINNVSVSFGANGNSSGRMSTIAINDKNSPIAKRSVINWGKSSQSKIEINDCMDPATVSKIGDNLIRLNGGVRFFAEYETDDMALFFLPMLSVLSVTDEDAGLFEELFYFTGAKWNSDLTGFTVSLLSVKMI